MQNFTVILSYRILFEKKVGDLRGCAQVFRIFCIYNFVVMQGFGPANPVHPWIFDNPNAYTVFTLT